ncbi:malate synthase A [Galbitalea sp. SE-J8]|uniref:malate synthase A n=1 Tax=Galbitalea sp. SE-J8 TaxID=3054952 RepID=UPI00259CDF2F|nr:malate synthase A [Galbitalea sp. SE-J8]MDM4762426.1 malate synthase A [Galbitalea sp. SE-J8]
MSRIDIIAPLEPRFDEVLTDGALDLVAALHDRFLHRRAEELHRRGERALAIANGRDPRFLDETRAVRDDPGWRVAGAGPGLTDRRVEMTGPTDRKMTINALNSGAKVWLADHEDALSPTWHNVIDGQLNLADAIRGTIDHETPDGRVYAVTASAVPTIVFRPRGWHLTEKHLRYSRDGAPAQPASASLVDFGLYVHHNARELVERGTGPYFYLPKLESRHEARLWDDVFSFTENRLRLPHGTIRATVLIETITAAFEMEEILWELRDHCAGLNAGRWDYLFSIIKNFRDRGRRFVLPDRIELTMEVPFMRAYTELLVATCHRRGAHAIGGMSAFIPSRRDAAANERAFARVTADKQREARDGFDGTWVAHPDLVPVARAVFDERLGDRPNQLDRLRDDVEVSARDLLDVAIDGEVTDAGVRQNVSIALRYLASWLAGTGAAALDGLMEDAATAEISRSQLWQWIAQRVVTREGTPVTREHVGALAAEVAARLGEHGPGEHGPGERAGDALEVFREVTLGDEFPSFLTSVGYARFLADDARVPVAA